MLTYDQIELIETERFIAALEEVMRANMEMMIKSDPEYADCWTWGVCYLPDLAISDISFEYGGEADKPEDFPEGTDVWVKHD